MQREQALRLLSNHLEEVRQRFGEQSLAVFGSVARDQAGPESDLDILVAYDRTPGLFGFLDLKEYLERLLGRPVDLVTTNALKNSFAKKYFRRQYMSTRDWKVRIEDILEAIDRIEQNTLRSFIMTSGRRTRRPLTP